jgi:hypothetical protein
VSSGATREQSQDPRSGAEVEYYVADVDDFGDGRRVGGYPRAVGQVLTMFVEDQ